MSLGIIEVTCWKSKCRNNTRVKNKNEENQLYAEQIYLSLHLAKQNQDFDKLTVDYFVILAKAITSHITWSSVEVSKIWKNKKEYTLKQVEKNL